MTTEALPNAQRRRSRGLRLSACVLGTATLAWGVVEVWRAQPAVRVSAQAAKVAAAPEPLEDVALRSLKGRFRDPGGASFREVRVYRFGPPDERAVCGFVFSREASGPPGGSEFVVRVILPGSGRTGGAPLPVLEEGPTLPRATANARGRYCRNADDPRTTPMAPAAAAVSTASPVAAPDPTVGGNAQPGGANGGGPGAVLKRVAVAGGNAANLRNGPGGGSAVIAVLPRGQVLDLFERAPGGWMRVGVGEPWGWVHSSLVIEGGP